MNVIWKFDLRPGVNIVEMPAGAELLHVGIQRGVPCLWALVDLDAERETRGFFTAATGYSFERTERMKYVGSAQCASHIFVWHVFEGLPANAREPELGVKGGAK